MLSNGYEDTARDIIWPIVRNDLNYVAEFWHQPGLNFWSSPSNVSLVHSFYITAAHHRALVEGGTFAKSIGQHCAVCESQAPQVLCQLQEYGTVSQTEGREDGFIVADMANGVVIDRSGRDTSTLLSSILTFDPEAGCNEETFQPCSQRMLRNHKEVVDSFRGWDINQGTNTSKAVALGRYPEGPTDRKLLFLTLFINMRFCQPDTPPRIPLHSLHAHCR